MEKLAADELVWVVVLVRLEQFTNDSSVDVVKCSQVKGETWRYVNTSNATFFSIEDIISTKTCNVQVRELVGLEVGKGDAIVNSSADTFTACIYDVGWTCIDVIHQTNYYVVSQKLFQSCELKKSGMRATLPFEVVMALNDIIKAKKKVEHWKRSIRIMDQGRQVTGRRLTKCHSSSLTGIWSLYFLWFALQKGERRLWMYALKML